MQAATRAELATLGKANKELRGLADDLKGKLGAAFGSFGWSGEGPKMILERMRGLRFRVTEDPLRVQLVPTPEDLTACESFGMRLVEAL